MNSSKAIGGYFELEAGSGDGEFIHSDGILLNSGRSAFEYLLRARKPSKVYLPKYICDAMLEPLEKLNVEYQFYKIDEKLELAGPVEVGDRELIIYVNYFGIKDAYARQLSDEYDDRLVLDCAPAYYFEPLETGDTFYSPRKFFGVADGGIVYTKYELDEDLETDDSSQRMEHLTIRRDEGAEAGYGRFQANEEKLSHQPIKLMSPQTKELLSQSDMIKARDCRRRNFAHLARHLNSQNRLELDVDYDGPMAYPFWSDDAGLKQRLISHKIFVATYWPNVLEWAGPDEVERQLAEQIIPLPIDQRYDLADMERILEEVNR